MFEGARNDHSAFVIAEVGQNHQGNLEFARQYIRVFASEGASAIKFQTRNNKYLFAQEAYDKSYNSEYSFGKSYGEHRESLELKPEWLPLLKQECVDHGVLFMATPFDEPSLELLIEVGVDILKLASFDLGNLPFAKLFGETRKPIILSTGGGNLNQISSTIDFLRTYDSEVAVLHCVSEYPCDYDKLGLSTIETLKSTFEDVVVGLSDHFNGTLSGPIAYLLGARIFEKHVTLNRSWKGTDHSFALEREGFRRFVRDINRVRFMLPPKNSSDIGQEIVFQKLGKSLTAKSNLEVGQEITVESLSGKIFSNKYIPVRESIEVIGKTMLNAVRAGEPLTYNDFK